MKTVAYGMAVLTAALLAALGIVRAQEFAPDRAWKERFAALQEEQDAQAGVAVSIVFDDSGSMNDNHKLAMAKKAFRAWIEHAPDGYRFGLVALNAGVLVPLQRNDHLQILAAVNRLVADGDTPLAQTIARAGADIRQRRAAGAVYERQVVVILTDGEDTTRRGIKGVQQEIRNLCANRVEVIAFGYQGEGDYMRGSATHFYSPENEQDISKGLNAIGSEIGDTSDVVVDGSTRAAMQNATVAPIATPAPADSPPPTPTRQNRQAPFSPYAPPASASPTPVAPRARHANGNPLPWMVLIGVFVLLRSIGRRR